jgi:hypothetical protein
MPQPKGVEISSSKLLTMRMFEAEKRAASGMGRRE